MRIYLIAILSLVLAVSCVEAPEYEQEKAVIDGWIDSDGYPVVLFTSSIVPDETNTSLADKIVRWGKVTISDGTQTIVMTGGPNENYFPPYRFTTYAMKGVPGKTYTITADFKDLHAEARCEMLSPTPISGFEVYPIEGNDTLRSAELKFITPEDVPAYYYITIRKKGETSRFMPTMLGTYKALRPNVEASIPLLNAKNQLKDESFTSQLSVGETYEIQFCRIPEEVFTFWNAYDNSVLFGGTQFFASTQSLTGNVYGGYGIWSAQGVSRATLEIK